MNLYIKYKINSKEAHKKDELQEIYLTFFINY